LAILIFEGGVVMKRLFSVFLIFIVFLGFSLSLEDMLNNENMFVISYESLTKNDGENGSSWVSVNGLVYDLSDVKAWVGGVHANGRFKAGKEYTYEIYSISPHGKAIVEKYKPIGILGFTIEDLKKFNSEKFLISYEGIVYDVTNSKTWKEKIGFNLEDKEVTYFIKEKKYSDFTTWDNIYQVGLLIIPYRDLSMYNGKNGMKAYVAVEGKIYDVTYSKRWKNGNHMNKHSAGEELTYEIIKFSPHGMKKLDNVFKIGYLVFQKNENYTIKENKVFKNGYLIGYIIK
jgi:predicted heme/steroid binding protein